MFDIYSQMVITIDKNPDECLLVMILQAKYHNNDDGIFNKDIRQIIKTNEKICGDLF
jgi:hypothetical protein